ncbi:MAG: hypothetical protein JW932_01590 [Deltaproteobacteria bacterium]|nr:hypothetical protein [Deltaproteobacteria bacterium]
MMDPITPQINQVRAQITGLKRPLGELLKDIEPRFIQLGNDLQSVYSVTNDLKRLTIETAKEIGGQTNNNFLGRIETLVNRSLVEFKDCQSDISMYIPNIQSGSKHLEQLRTMSYAIKKISKSLNIVAMNIGVESSRSTGCEEMFASFAQEIKRLAKTIHEVSVNIHNDAETARSIQLDTLGDIAVRQTQLEDLAHKADKTARESVEKIERLFDTSLASLGKAEEHGQEINHKIGEIVEAIQFHDITRQQLEHVINALVDVEEICRKSCIHDDADPKRSNQIVHVHSILELQVAHIKQVLSQLDDVQDKVEKAFKDVGHEVEMMLDSGLDLEVESSDEEGFDKKFMTLRSALERLNHLISQGHDLGKQVEKSMRQSSETVSKLSAHLDLVESISMELHIKAINAVVMSKRLGGEGRTLEVLAQEVTEVSKESNSFVAQVVETLVSISEYVKVLGDCSWRREKESRCDDTGSTMSLDVSVDHVSKIYANIEKDTSIALERSQTLQKLISRIGSDLGFITDVKERLSDILKKIESAIKSLSQLITDVEKKLHIDLSSATQRYTMESEREICQQIQSWGGKANIERAHWSWREGQTIDRDQKNIDEKVNHRQEKQSDLGENVELF